MFGIKTIGRAVNSVSDSLHKFNQTIHTTAEAAARTESHIKTGVNGAMAAKGVKDCVVSYQCNDMICFTVSVVGTTADVGNLVCGNIPGLTNVTPVTTFLSVGCKTFVRLCQTGRFGFSCNDPI
jgi:hypothetical protein